MTRISMVSSSFVHKKVSPIWSRSLDTFWCLSELSLSLEIVSRPVPSRDQAWTTRSRTEASTWDEPRARGRPCRVQISSSFETLLYVREGPNETGLAHLYMWLKSDPQTPSTKSESFAKSLWATLRACERARQRDSFSQRAFALFALLVKFRIPSLEGSQCAVWSFSRRPKRLNSEKGRGPSKSGSTSPLATTSLVLSREKRAKRICVSREKERGRARTR